MSKSLRLIKVLGATFLSVGAISICAGAINHSLSSKTEETKAATYTQTVEQYYSNLSINNQSVALKTTTATQATLKTALYNKIKITDAGWSYKGLWTAYQTTDKRSDGTVWDIYSDKTSYTFTSDQCGTYSVEGDCYNREHMIPQSIFNENSPMVSDAHHVYPSDGKVNGMRSDHPHGNVTSATYTSNDGYKLGTGPTTGSTTVFEPKDCYKGDIARVYFYFVTCYQANIPNYSFSAFAANTYPSLNSTYLSIYLQWAKDDPVSQKEIDRNNTIYATQGNRNPFIDYPYAIGAIWDSSNASDYGTAGQYVTSGQSSTPSVSISSTSASVAVGSTTTLSATSSDSSQITWSSSDTSVAKVNNSTSNVQVNSGTSVTINGVSEGTATITAKATINSTVYQKQCNVTVSSSGGGDSSSGGVAISISEGDTVALISSDASKELTSFSTSSTVYGIGTSYSSTPAGTLQFTVESGSTSGTYSFKNGSNYLYWTSGNSLNVNSTKSANTSWSVSFDSSGNATILNSSDTSRQILWNVSATRFATYAGQSVGTSYYNVQLYKISSSGGGSSEVTLSSISLNTSSVTKTYSVGDTFSYSGLIVTATYSDNSTATVTPTSVSSPDMSTAGLKTITVTYTEGGVTKTAEYTITVTSSSGNGSYTITYESFTTTGYAASFNSDLSSIFAKTDCGNQSSTIQFKRSSGLLYNTAEIRNITSIVATKTSSGNNYLTVYGGNASQPTTTTISASNSGNVYTYDFSSYSYAYFKMVCSSTGASNFDSIVINYSTPSSSSASLTLNTGTATLDLNGTKTVSLTATASGGSGNVTWTTSDSTVASISASSGNSITVTGKAAGTATITASYSGATATCSITVIDTTFPYAVGTGYAMSFTDASATRYFTGTMSGYYGATSTSISDGVTMYFETNGSGYNLYFLDPSRVKNYITVVKSGNYTNFTISTSAPASTWGFNGTDLIYTLDNTSYYLGGKSTYETFGFYNSTTNVYLASFTQIETADTWAATFLTTVTCNNGATPPSTTGWSTMKTKYQALSTAEQTFVNAAGANENGSILEQAIARYCEVLTKYPNRTNYPNYLEKAGYSNRINTPIIKTANATLIFAMVGITSTMIGFAFVGYWLKKKKEN